MIARLCLIFPNESKSMNNLGAVLQQLKQERSRLDKAITALSEVTGSGNASMEGNRPKRQLSVAARKRIAAAQRARWAKVRAGKKAN
jgi:ABC-type transporter Mla subunit MlaD